MARPQPSRGGFDVRARIARVLTEHDYFMDSNDDDPERAKRFYARHNAAKAAISHIQALQQIEGKSVGDTPDNGSTMVARARAALAQENLLDEPEAEY